MDPTYDASGIRPTNAGNGLESYAQNSTNQRIVVNFTKDLIFQAILKTIDINEPQFNSSNPFRIADLGCSTGQNTIISMQNIVDAVEHKYKTTNLNNPTSVPEFQVFFNDHIDNDFNTLFRDLATSTSKYFISGVPGSFYNRLFPEKSLHIVHSSSALHWLSKVPDDVQDKSSLAYNKDHIHCSGDKELVTKAYVAQFEKDMGTFLEARAKELVEGGLLIILIPSGTSLIEKTQIQTSLQTINELLGQSLFDLAKMGSITEEKVRSFNLPCYYPTVDLIEAVICENNCFTIESLSQIQTLLDSIPFTIGKTTSLAIRSVYEGMMKEHFGSENMNPLFDIFTQKLEDYYAHIGNNKPPPLGYLFAIIKRKAF